MKGSLGFIFLFDALGALVSALFLLLVLPYFEAFFGMPSEVLFKLGVVATFLFLFSGICFLNRRNLKVNVLVWIASGNIFYTIVSFLFMYLFWNSLTVYGISYFLLEKIIIFVLVSYELRFFILNRKSSSL